MAEVAGEAPVLGLALVPVLVPVFGLALGLDLVPVLAPTLVARAPPVGRDPGRRATRGLMIVGPDVTVAIIASGVDLGGSEDITL